MKQIIGYNSQAKGGKVTGNAKSTEDLVNILNSLEEKDALEIPENNVLFTIDQDTKKLNNYRLNYHCNTLYGDRRKAKEDFIKLARKLYPQQSADIDAFEKEYDLELKGSERTKMVLSWAFRDNFYWQLVQQITRNTNDPKRLAYLRLPIKDIHEAIQAQYRTDKLNNEFYLVLEMTEEERHKLLNSVKNYLVFTSFVKGFSNSKEAMAEWKELKKKSEKYVHLTVSMDRRSRPDHLDFGFVEHKGRILVNIYNVFEVEEASKRQSAQLTYGILPVLHVKRQDKEFRLNGMSDHSKDMTRNYDFLEDLMSKVDGQATILQINGYYKDSLEVYDRKVDLIRKTNESE